MCECIYCKQIYNLTDISEHDCEQMKKHNKFININLEDIIDNAIELKIVDQYKLMKRQSKRKLYHKGGSMRNQKYGQLYIETKRNYLLLQSMCHHTSKQIKSNYVTNSSGNSNSAELPEMNVLFTDTFKFDIHKGD